MARTVLWNRVLLDEFIDLASLSEDEERVIRAWGTAWTAEALRWQRTLHP